MRINIKVAVLIKSILFSSVAWGAEGLSRDEIISMIPKGVEKDSQEEIQNWQILIDSGESIYQPLSDILLDPNQKVIADDVISIFVKSKGDKTIPLEALRTYLEVNAKKVPLDRTVFSVVIAMGAMGGKVEAKALRELVDPEIFQDPDQSLLRNSVEGNLAKIEKRLKTQELDAGIDNRTKDRMSKSSSESRLNSTGDRKGLVAVIRSNWVWFVCVVGLLFAANFLRKWSKAFASKK